jgi:hypothetical protein
MIDYVCFAFAEDVVRLSPRQMELIVRQPGYAHTIISTTKNDNKILRNID